MTISVNMMTTKNPIDSALMAKRLVQAAGLLLVSLLLSLSSMTTTAELTADGPALTAEEARLKLLASQPDLPVEGIRESHVKGFFEVTMPGGPTLYMNDTADYFFAGDLFLVNSDGLVNATEMGKTELRKEMLASLDKADMIIYAPRPELTRATVTVFTDIDCGFCRKLHLEIPELNRLGIAVRYLAFPRAGVGSQSYDKAVSAWCADNPQIALTQAKAGDQIDQRTCANPVAAQYALAAEFGVNGTPAVIYENGFLQGGYLPAAEMARQIFATIN